MKLRTKYLGLDLSSPVVVAACSLSEKVDHVMEMEDHGAGAVVLYSLFEEQIRKEQAEQDRIMASTANTFPEASSYFMELDEYRSGTEQYLEHIQQLKSRVDFPIIASLNGISNEGWIDYSKQMEQAGADALEINLFYIPGDFSEEAEDIEKKYIDIVKRIKDTVSIPVAIKLNPYFSSMGNMALKLNKAGADGLVLFNRFYQPDFDIMKLKVLSNLEYSTPNEIRLPLLWISMLYGQIDTNLAATTGVHGVKEVIKYLLAGADVAMVASALYKKGMNVLGDINRDLANWMEEMNFDTLKDFRGLMSQQNIADPTAFERANYIKILGRA